jgi:hypothetical protein
MAAERPPPKDLRGTVRRALGAPDRWLDDPRVEFSVYLVLIVLAPLIQPGLELIFRALGRLGR